MMESDWIRVSRRKPPGVGDRISSVRNIDGWASNITSIFVDNLPESMDEERLFQLFSPHGEVVHSVIPNKRSLANSIFGFVRFRHRKEALSAIKAIKGMSIRGHKLYAKIASFPWKGEVVTQNQKVKQNLSEKYPANAEGKTGDKANSQTQSELPKGEPVTGCKATFSEILTGCRKDTTHFYSEARKGRGTVNSTPCIKVIEAGHSWLWRSAIAVLPSPRSIDSLRVEIFHDFGTNIQIRYLGGLKVLLTFDSTSEMDSIFRSGKFSQLKKWFANVDRWKPELYATQSRVVWLNCYGVPLQAWNDSSFSMIGKIWGEVVFIDNATSKALDFSVGKIQIVTEFMEGINEVIHLECEGLVFPVRVMEEHKVPQGLLNLINDSFSHGSENSQAEEDREVEREDNSQANVSPKHKEDNCASLVDETPSCLLHKQCAIVEAPKEDQQLQSFNLQLEVERSHSILVLDGGHMDQVMDQNDRDGGYMGQVMDQNDRPHNDVGLGDKCLTDQVILAPMAPVNFSNIVGDHTVQMVIPLPPKKRGGRKGKRKVKPMDEILGNFNKIIFRRKGSKIRRPKGAVCRPAAAAASLSISSEGINNRNRILLNKAQKVCEENLSEIAVPTAGAFYMHDDRFRGNVGGRNRRTFVGKRLWESKDERKWGHDKFEEITVQDRHYEEGARNSRGRYRAREKSRGADRGYPSAGNKSRAYNNNNQIQGPKSVRGRGPRRYEPSQKNYGGAPPMPNKKSGKPIEKTLHDSSEREPMASSNSKSDPAPYRTQMFASSLNSASPPFYPSSSSNKEPSLTPKRDEKAVNRNLPNSNTMVRGKSVVGSVGMEKLNINGSASAICGKPSTTSQLPFSGSSSVNNTQPLQSRAQGRGVAPHNQVNRASPPTQLHNVQRNPVQTRVQPSLQASIQQLGQSPGSGSQTSSPPKTALSMKSFQPTKVGSPSESGKSNTALVGKGRGGIQASGRGSFPYGGAQVMGASGNMGSGHGDPNFAFLPVMPFGGHHPGLPAVGMAFPGYVGQPQLGMGNSEMAWLPVLAGAAGALGAAYCSPYLAVDGAYHSRPSGQTSSSGATSKENNANKPNNELKPSQRSEAASDEFGQRQKKYQKIYRDEFWPVKHIYHTYLDKLIRASFQAHCDIRHLFWSTLGRNIFHDKLRYI